MPQHDIEITITRTGQVQAHIKGVKGKACLAYSKLLAEIVGRIESQQMTREFYEPEQKAGIKVEQKVNDEQGGA
jgi:hypothetical protein